jgi:hypothetical protein
MKPRGTMHTPQACRVGSPTDVKQGPDPSVKPQDTIAASVVGVCLVVPCRLGLKRRGEFFQDMPLNVRAAGGRNAPNLFRLLFPLEVRPSQ